MFSYNKFLEFPIKIKNKNPRLANIVVTQYGGPNGELGASLRYLTQDIPCLTKSQKDFLQILELRN